jgi:hypothetical protein
MKTQPSGTAVDLYARYFPGEPYTTVFEPTPEQPVAVTRHAQVAARNGAELEQFMKALGVMSYQPTAQPSKRPAHPKRDAARAIACPQGHDRKQHSTADRSGRMYCVICKRADGERRRERAAMRKKEAA